MPKLSVIMPVFNEEKYLKDAIESILNQTFKDFEFIIIDDGSEDKSREIIDFYKDPRIKFYKSEKKGIADQLNFGISNSNSPYIARMDADDVAIDNRFELQLSFLFDHPEVLVIGSNVLFIDEKGKLICQKKYPEFHEDIEFMMPIESSVCHPAVMINKETLENSLYKNGFEYAEDHELFLNLIRKGCKFYNLQENLLKYRPKFFRYDETRMKKANMISYNLGMDYLNNLRTESSQSTNEYNINFRMGLIEYYRGSLSVSRGYFLKAFKISGKGNFKLFRYVGITLLGQRLIDFLRKSKLLPKFSIYLNRFLKIDLHRIEK